MRTVLEWDSNDIYLHRQREAVRTSAALVSEHMRRAPAHEHRFELIARLLAEVDIDGIVCEFGVHRGESLSFIAKKVPQRQVFGFDSFEGLPEDWVGKFRKGHFKFNINQVLRESNVELVKGFFDDSLPGFLQRKSEKFAFLHIDCDLYSSTKTIFDLAGDRIVPGTIMVFDDFFNYPGWDTDGEYLAFMEFVRERNLTFEYLGYADSGSVAVRILTV